MPSSLARLAGHFLRARTSVLFSGANPMSTRIFRDRHTSVAFGEAPLMGTLIYYQCREPRHLSAPSRLGLGGIVFRHGTAAYCDGIGVDGAHHWEPTGGVPIETLFTTRMRWREHDDVEPARAGHIPDPS